jgi:DNA-3-methyladenine glycosylase
MTPTNADRAYRLRMPRTRRNASVWSQPLATPLPRDFFARPAYLVAPELVGKLLVHRDGRVARLVEVEAYDQHDPAAHTFRGPTARNASMFGPPGHLYVYRSYGLHWAANATCAEPGTGAGVLLRAAEPLAGIDAMAALRGTQDPRTLLAGPGRLAQAFGIDRGLDGSDLCGEGALTLLDDGATPEVLACRRIGITKAADLPLRFVAKGSRFLSRPAGK